MGAELLRRRGHEFTAELKDEMMGLQPRPSFEIMIRRCNLSDTAEELIDESNRLFVSSLEGRIAPMTGLMELLDALERAGIPKAIATSSSHELVEACLKPLDMRRRFQFVLGAEDIAHGKPHPEIYLTAARRFAVAPAEMMVLEDSQNGCVAAAAAGAFAVAVPGSHSQSHDFRSASLVLSSLADPRLYAALGIPIQA